MRYVRFRDETGIRHGEWVGAGAEIEAYPAFDDRIALETKMFAVDDVDVLPPCDPSKIVCVGRNYADHADERNAEIPDRPLLFLKPPNAITSHGRTVALPSGKDRLDYEAELAVVIGRRAKDVSREDVDDVIAGYTCLNDLSNRDDQDVETNWVRGKAFDESAPIGPVIASPDELPEDAHVRCRVNGELRQDASKERFIFLIPELLEEITTYMTLVPGDIVTTGTPEGVGPLSDGDTVEVEIDGIGTLRNDIRIPDR